MKTLYECEVCRATYDNARMAEACEAQGLPTDIKVGDIIRKHDGYGWHTGPDHWIMFDTGKHHEISTRDFYWLVIDISRNNGSANGRHCNEATCVTRGVVNGASVDNENVWGVNRFNHYIEKGYGTDPKVVIDPPAKVREEANEFMRRGYTIDRDGAVKSRKEK